jgi:hypothetical protein
MSFQGGHNVVLMDYQVIGDVSKGFSTAADALNTVGKILTVLINILRASAFLSFGTSAALAQYLDGINQQVQNLANVCQNDFAAPLLQARTDHQNGDVAGKNYFKGLPSS